MTVLTRMQKMLDRHHIPYRIMPHAETFTAKETVKALGVPVEQMVKTVIINAGGRYVMLAVPAGERVDLAKVARVLGTSTVRLATEKEIERLCPDCEVGAMPPFGDLYEMEELVDHAMLQCREIVCEAGTHREAVTMRTGDFTALTHPTIADLHADSHVKRGKADPA
ncbi:MAG TPA: YbaK/EbsC family protein [Nitrospiria bacterium]|nr:YbaK/EbsC family protein [Nitrospiria bacterium]